MPMSETERLKKVVKEAIHQLRDRGVTESEIYNLLIDKRPKISRLIITPRKRLILSDYGVEVKMEPLHKAVYILFLRHPEGIRIKEISDYQATYHCIDQNLHSTDYTANYAVMSKHNGEKDHRAKKRQSGSGLPPDRSDYL